MLKKVLLPPLFVLFLLFIVPFSSAQTIVFGGGEMIVKGGTTNSFGAGTVAGIGKFIGPNIIMWGQWNGYKTGEGTSVDNGLTGFSVLTDHLFEHFLKGGLFLTMMGGIGKQEEGPVTFATLTDGGFYFDLSEKSKLWIGGSYSSIEGVNVYSARMGLSVALDWK